MNNEPSYFGLTNDHTWLSVDEEYYKKLKPTHRMKCYTHPEKTKHLSLQTTEDGELVAVTYTDDEHRIVEVLWEKPPAKTLTEPSVKEITDLWLDVINNIPANDKRPREWHFANAILRKAQEK